MSRKCKKRERSFERNDLGSDKSRFAQHTTSIRRGGEAMSDWQAGVSIYLADDSAVSLESDAVRPVTTSRVRCHNFPGEISYGDHSP